MKYVKEDITGLRGIKIIVEKSGKIVGRVFLYLINNDLHDKPYGLLEDLFVTEEYRQQGIGGELIKKVIKEAKERNCYKLITQSRYSREKIHQLYQSFGFVDYGKNFRLDF